MAFLGLGLGLGAGAGQLVGTKGGLHRGTVKEPSWSLYRDRRGGLGRRDLGNTS